MSDLDRITGLKHLRVRGMPQVRLAATLKAAGLNIHRAIAFKKRHKRYKTGKKPIDSSCNSLILHVREQIKKQMGHLKTMFGKIALENYLSPDLLLTTG